MKSFHKLLIAFLILSLLVSIGFIVYLKFGERNKEQDLSSLIEDKGNNKIIEKYVKDSVTHTIYQDRFINDTKSEKQTALGKTYADSLARVLKISIDKIDQVTKINAKLEAQMALSTKTTSNGQTEKKHKDEFLDITYYPDTDSLKLAYDIRLNDARYKDKKWLLGRENRYIDLFSDDKRVTINGVKSYRLKEAPPNRFGIGLSAGYGLGKDGDQVKLIPYLGIGFNFNLLEF